MADFTILDFPETTAPTGLKIYIVSDLADFHITYENLIKEFTDYKDESVQTVTDTNQAASYTKAVDAGTKLESIDIAFVSGTPTVKVGTSAGAKDVMSLRTITASKDSNNSLIKTFKGSTTLYITITGGVVSIKYNFRYNYDY